VQAFLDGFDDVLAIRDRYQEEEEFSFTPSKLL
jgi:hypothetical protein